MPIRILNFTVLDIPGGPRTTQTGMFTKKSRVAAAELGFSRRSLLFPVQGGKHCVNIEKKAVG